MSGPRYNEMVPGTTNGARFPRYNEVISGTTNSPSPRYNEVVSGTTNGPRYNERRGGKIIAKIGWVKNYTVLKRASSSRRIQI